MIHNIFLEYSIKTNTINCNVYLIKVINTYIGNAFHNAVFFDEISFSMD